MKFLSDYVKEHEALSPSVRRAWIESRLNPVVPAAWFVALREEGVD